MREKGLVGRQAVVNKLGREAPEELEKELASPSSYLAIMPLFLQLSRPTGEQYRLCCQKGS